MSSLHTSCQVAFRLGNTKLLFMNCHLAAHADKMQAPAPQVGQVGSLCQVIDWLATLLAKVTRSHQKSWLLGGIILQWLALCELEAMGPKVRQDLPTIAIYSNIAILNYQRVPNIDYFWVVKYSQYSHLSRKCHQKWPKRHRNVCADSEGIGRFWCRCERHFAVGSSVVVIVEVIYCILVEVSLLRY